MGSTALIDIISSMLIGGLLLLAALRMNDQATKTTFQCQTNLTVQQNMTAVVQNIEWDFRKIGYCSDPKQTADPTRYILYGDQDSIAFVADLDNVGVLNTVKWYLGDYINGPNPRIRKLFRQVDGESPVQANLGVTEFSLEYFDATNNRIATVIAGAVPSPQLIQLTIKTEPTAAYDTSYSQTFSYWRQTRLVSRNIRLNR